MIQASAYELAAAVNGQLVFEDDSFKRRVVKGLTWDSRTVEPGNIFLAMPGERVDGNDFTLAAMRAGAGAVVATRQPSESVRAVAGELVCPYIVVTDGVKALDALASWWRGKLHAVVVGITGSVGKTSTKDLVRSVLSESFACVATTANHNNEIGVPATVLQAGPDTEMLVVEMGMRGLGQIASLAKTVRPSVAIVSNVGVSHLELLGSQENIARAKAELVEALPENGICILNADDAFTPFIIEHAHVRERALVLRTFGLAQDADVRAQSVAYDALGRASFTLCLPSGDTTPVTLPLPGEHNVRNALAAAAVGSTLGMGAQAIAAGLEHAQPSGMRMEVLCTKTGVTVVNDAYNANPDSMRGALATVANMHTDGKRVAVLGDMGELGADEAAMHAMVGEYAAAAGLDMLICIGELSASALHKGALSAGMSKEAIINVSNVNEAVALLNDTLESGDLLLVKASRFMGLERIVEGIV